MPSYGAAAIKAIYPGDSETVWSAESPATAAASQQVMIPSGPGLGVAKQVSVEIVFSATPGTFEIQVQDADTDAAGDYVSMAFGGASPGLINAVNATFAARIELQVNGRFVRLLMSNDPANAVTVTAKIVRH